MKKSKYLTLYFTFFSFLFLFFSFNKVEAAQECEGFTNNYGIEISKEECNRLQGLGFSVEYIQDMTEEEYELNKDIYAEDMSIEKKYIKTTYYYSNGNTPGDKVANNSESTVKVIKSEELSETEFYNQLLNEKVKEMQPLGTETGHKETSYKLFTVKIAKLSNGKYRAYTELDWKKIPKTREEDIMGATFRYPNYFIVNHTERFGRQSWGAKGCHLDYGGCVDSKEMYGNIYYDDDSGKWLNNSFAGNAIAMNLKNDFYQDNHYYRITKLNLYSYFNFAFNRSGYPYYNVQIKGAYNHQINSSPINLSGVSITWGPPVLDFSFNQDKNYDGEITAQAYIKK